MIDLLDGCRQLLAEADTASTRVETGQVRALAFESATVLGFIIEYDDPIQLLKRWRSDVQELVAGNQLALRRAQAKAWNTYTILLASARVDSPEQLVALGAVEEDLTGTRKIARAGIDNIDALRTALLPLLPIQNTPRLEAVDMISEIDMRTTELPTRVVEAFLSQVPDAMAIKILEEEP